MKTVVFLHALLNEVSGLDVYNKWSVQHMYYGFKISPSFSPFLAREENEHESKVLRWTSVQLMAISLNWGFTKTKSFQVKDCYRFHGIKKCNTDQFPGKLCILDKYDVLPSDINAVIWIPLLSLRAIFLYSWEKLDSITADINAFMNDDTSILLLWYFLL